MRTTPRLRSGSSGTWATAVAPPTRGRTLAASRQAACRTTGNRRRDLGDPNSMGDLVGLTADIIFTLMFVSIMLFHFSKLF